VEDLAVKVAFPLVKTCFCGGFSCKSSISFGENPFLAVKNLFLSVKTSSLSQIQLKIGVLKANQA